MRVFRLVRLLARALAVHAANRPPSCDTDPNWKPQRMPRPPR